MYDWRTMTLTAPEIEAKDTPKEMLRGMGVLQQAHRDMAFLKLAINKSIRELRDAFHELDYPPHEVYLVPEIPTVWLDGGSFMEGLPDEVKAEFQSRHQLREVDHPEYQVYFDAADRHRDLMGEFGHKVDKLNKLIAMPPKDVKRKARRG